MLCVVDKLAQPLPSVSDAPDQMRMGTGSKIGPSPVGFEALDDLVDLMLVCGDDGVVARLGQIFGLPVERLDVGSLIVDDHRLLMGDIECRVAVDYLDSSRGQLLSRLVVLLFAAAPRGIQHDTDVHAALVRRGDGLQQRGIGEDEHLDPKRLSCIVNCFDDRQSGIVWQDNYGAGHGFLGARLRSPGFRFVTRFYSAGSAYDKRGLSTR